MASDASIYNLQGQGVTPLLNPLDVQAKKIAIQNALAQQTLIQQEQQRNSLALDAMRLQAGQTQRITGANEAWRSQQRALLGAAPAATPTPIDTTPRSAISDPFGNSLASAPAFDAGTPSVPQPAAAPSPAVQRPGVPTIAQLAALGYDPGEAAGLLESLQKVDQGAAAIEKSHAETGDKLQEQIANVANAAVKANMNPAVVSGLLQHFGSMGPQYEQMANQVGAHLAQLSPADQLAYVQGLAAESTKVTEAGAKASEAQTAASKYADERLDKDTAQLAARLGATTSQSDWGSELGNASPAAIARLNPPAAWSQAAAKTMLAKGSTAAEQVTAAETAKQHGIENANKQAELNIQRAELAFRRASIENVQLTPQALDQMATMFATTGVLPNLGMGAAVAATRSGIINRAAQMYPNVSFSSNAAAYQANKHSLNTVTGALDTLTAFEGAGLKNLKMFTDAAAKLPDTGVPWLNTPVRLLDERTVGSKNMAVVNAARDVALREIARVTNDPKLSGVLSDSARHEVQSLSPKDATIPQIMAVAQVLRQDMANVHQSLQDQKDAIGSRLGASPAGATATNTPNETPKTDGVQQFSKGDKVLYNGKQHTVIGYAANGKLQLSE